MTGKATSSLLCLLLLLCIGVFQWTNVAAAQARRTLPYPPGQTRPGQPSYPGQPQQPAIPAYMKIRVEDNQVTAEIRATPLQQVLQEIADRTGVIFEVQSQDNPLISISLYRVSLREAVERIVQNENSIFYYGQDTSHQGRIEFVRMFPRANEPQQPSLLYIGTGQVTKSGDDTIDTPEQALKVLTESQSLEARQKAIEVLAASKSDLAVQALTAALADPAPEIRAAAIEGLAGLGARSALPGIIRSLKDEHPGVRTSAIYAVALLGDPENVKDLKPLMRDSDASVAAAADVAIRKLSIARRP